VKDGRKWKFENLEQRKILYRRTKL